MLVKPDFQPVAKLKVVGVGGAGGNAVNTMMSQYDIQGVEFYAVNTDAQALKNSLANTISIGEELTRGLGVGGNPDLGTQAAEESIDMLHEHLAGADMVFVTAGMGGGTGTGAAPIVAKVAKEHGALTVGVITKPFTFEGKRRMDIALEGIERIREYVDTLIIVPNQRILEIVEEDMTFLDSMRKADEVLALAVKSIAGLITQTGFINVDFADVKTVMTGAGTAMMGMGVAIGDDRALEATRKAITSPMLEMSIDGATGVLMNVIGGRDMGMKEVQIAAEAVHDAVDPNATIIFGATIDESLDEKKELQVTVLATGFAEKMQGKETYIMAGGKRTTSSLSDDEEEDILGGVKPAATQLSTGDETESKPTSSHGSKLDQMDEDDLDVPAFMRRK